MTVRAGAVVMDIYRGHAAVRTKADFSPVCDADEKAEALIQAELAGAFPGVPVLAEEAASGGVMPDVDGRFILVDPVDGTKEFLNRNGEFTVNIALIEHGVPRAGAVYAPALGRLWFAGEEAFACSIAPGGDLRGAAIVPIRSRPSPATGFVVMASRSHADHRTEDFLSGCRSQTGAMLVLRSNSARLQRGRLTSTPASAQPWNGIPRQATPCFVQRGNRLARRRAPFVYGKTDAGYRNGSFVAWGDAADGVRRMREPAPA